MVDGMIYLMNEASFWFSIATIWSS